MSDGRRQDVPLNASQRSTLDALCRIVLPHLFEDADERFDLVALVVDRLERAPRHVTVDLTIALSLLGSRLGGLLVTGRPTRFANLPIEKRRRRFERWSTSALPVARSVHQALRKLILTSWYATDEAQRELGARAPLHTRVPVVAWEGPLLSSEASDDDVVARSPDRNASVPRSNPRPRPVPDGVTTPNAFTGDRSVTADVVVIGSGAGGAVAAARFAEAGRQVIILEEGDYLHAPDFNELEREMVPRLFAEQAMRATVDGSVSLLQGGAVGGGTTVNWMLMLRPPEYVLDEWVHSLHLPEFGATDVARHLDRVAAEVHARVVPDDAHAPSNLAILNGARALGWHARSAMINAKGCVRAGTCSLGCRYDAKQSGLLTYLPRALAAHAQLYAGASVERVEILERNASWTPRKRVRATIRDPQSGEVRGTLAIDAPIVVLAAGAVGTPVILERSGLGGGGVGKYLRLHPTTGVTGLYTDEIYSFAGIPQSSLCDEFIRRDANGYGFWIECAAFLPALASAALPGFGEGHRTFMRQLHNTVPFIVLVRDGSGEEGSLGSVSVDRSGRVRIRHRLSSADAENLRFGIEAAARLHLAAGAREAISFHTPFVRASRESDLRAMREASVAPNRVALFSAHVNGTCRLGVNPSTSGCGPTGERHGVPGLYVMDGSILPTAPGVNPQWTIMALASLLAERAIS